MVPGFNDDAADLEAIGRFAAAVPGVRQVNLLPYHETGASKFARLGRTYRAAGRAPPVARADGRGGRHRFAPRA